MKIWFAIIQGKIKGPYSKEEIILKVRKGDLRPSDQISLGTKHNWKPAISWTYFATEHFPALQKTNHDILENLHDRWIVLAYQQKTNSRTQIGPLTTRQINYKLNTGVIKRSDYIWKKGLSGWAQIGDRPEFSISSDFNIG